MRQQSAPHRDAPVWVWAKYNRACERLENQNCTCTRVVVRRPKRGCIIPGGVYFDLPDQRTASTT